MSFQETKLDLKSWYELVVEMRSMKHWLVRFVCAFALLLAAMPLKAMGVCAPSSCTMACCVTKAATPAAAPKSCCATANPESSVSPGSHHALDGESGVSCRCEIRATSSPSSAKPQGVFTAFNISILAPEATVYVVVEPVFASAPIVVGTDSGPPGGGLFRVSQGRAPPTFRA